MRLGAAMLRSYRGPAQVPAYDRTTITPGILHIGVGAFHRAHQAQYVDDLLAQTPDWGILGVSLHSPRTSTALTPQDGLYTLAVREPDKTALRIVGSLVNAQHGPEAAIRALADPRIRLVTLTVTEKGYTDLADPDGLGRLLVAGLSERAQQGGAPVTILSCDNLMNNGRVARDLVEKAADLIAPDLRAYLEQDVSFPCSMVDRITPATTEADRAEIEATAGYEDHWPVVTEPFSQWVMEDAFAAPRPAFERVGAEIVSDVAPYETMKLRLLNGAHTTLATLGTLAGYETVADAMKDPALSELIGHTAQSEVFPTLALPEQVKAPYWQSLMQRFKNPSIRHALLQIATDTSQKIPVRILPPLIENARNGVASPGLTFALAGWLAFVRRRTREGHRLLDPLAEILARAAQAPAPEMVRLLCDPDAPLNAIADMPDVQNNVSDRLARIEATGCEAAIRELLGATN